MDMSSATLGLGRFEARLLRRAARHEALSRRFFSLLYLGTAMLTAWAAVHRYGSDPHAMQLMLGAALLVAAKAGADLEGSFWESLVVKLKRQQAEGSVSTHGSAESGASHLRSSAR
jgi:hypothetical protein